MTEMTAFERRVADGMLHRAGPIRPVDDLAVYESIIAANRQKGWGFSMFSALKFVAAAAIVALFGGSLLTAVLTTPQGDETAPAASTESPSPITTADLLSGMVTEEVEPDVFRVLDDGVRGLARGSTLVAGGDGSLWVLEGEGFEGSGFYRLGGGDEGLWPEEAWDSEAVEFEVAPDGTVWAAWERGGGQTEHVVHSHHGPFRTTSERALGMGWKRHPVGGHGDVIEITSDGTVWSRWWDESTESEVFGYLGTDGWQPVGEVPYFGTVQVSDTGDIWVVSVEPPSRFVDGAWQPYPMIDLNPVSPVDVGPDGTVWGISVDESDLPGRVLRFDGSEWEEWEPPDWLAPDGNDWRWNGDEWVVATEYSDDNLYAQVMPEDVRVAPDGAAWVISRLGRWGDQPVCTDDFGGVSRFDGETWSRFLSDSCIESMDIAADGSIWLLATESDARYPTLHTYVISPEAVVATE